ncbi:MAG: YbhB/YbcL family Raf kinase inhibitor-like protein [Methylocystis sp.]|nr:YbhB/YbcL family Raf kinase inhibitor-like protein [Methylocystis sp.]
MRLSSTAFADGATIPRRFTCDGEDLSPALQWSDAPAPTKSFVLLCDDPDAPAGTWRHWAAYDIPADVTSLAEDAGRSGGRVAFKQAINDFNRPGYGGPCPPRRHGIHHYHFRLLALSHSELALPGKDPSCQEVERQARQHMLAEAKLVGVYQR